MPPIHPRPAWPRPARAYAPRGRGIPPGRDFKGILDSEETQGKKTRGKNWSFFIGCNSADVALCSVSGEVHHRHFQLLNSCFSISMVSSTDTADLQCWSSVPACWSEVTSLHLCSSVWACAPASIAYIGCPNYRMRTRAVSCL